MSAVLVRAAVAATLLWSGYAHALSASEPNESDLDSHRRYQNSDGESVHSPARSISGEIPKGASARCRDGTYSFSRHHTGTCSRHRGVATWVH